MLDFWSGGRFLAVTAFIVAFPPVFSQFGKVEGLKLSLSVLLFYVARGLSQLLVEAGVVYGSRKGAATQLDFLHRTGKVFLFSEVPLVLTAAYLGLRFLPTWLTVPYETGLQIACPVVILVEGFAAMTVILSSGQLWSESLAEQAAPVRAVVAGGCLALYGVSLSVIGHLYWTDAIRTVLIATLIAVVLTLVAVLTAGTVLAPHGSITDSALLMLYVTYNLWTISRRGPHIAIRSEGASLLTFMSQGAWSALPKEPLLGVVGGLLNMFSVELVTAILLQMAIFLAAAKLYRRAVGLEAEIGEQPEASAWLLGVLWPCFGKAVLVAVYTYAWLMYTRQAMLPLYLDPTMWRWMNIFGCILLYTYHLIWGGDREDFDLHLD